MGNENKLMASTSLSDNKSEILSPKSHWDKVVGGVKLPRIYDKQQYNIKQFDKLFNNLFDKNSKTLFEVGCGSSAWLPYFKIHYGLSVSGLDYSEIGCDLARMNLECFGRQANENIYCADVTNLNEMALGAHDIVFTYGLIEHFEDPKVIVENIKGLVSSGGQIVTIVPNLHGLNGFLSKIFTPEIYSMHKVIGPRLLKDIHESCGFKTEYCEDFGVFYPYAIPWENSDLFFMKSKLLRKLFLKAVDLVSKFLIYLLRKFAVQRNSGLWSPYVIYIGRL